MTVQFKTFRFNRHEGTMCLTSEYDSRMGGEFIRASSNNFRVVYDNAHGTESSAVVSGVGRNPDEAAKNLKASLRKPLAFARIIHSGCKTARLEYL